MDFDEELPQAAGWIGKAAMAAAAIEHGMLLASEQDDLALCEPKPTEQQRWVCCEFAERCI